MINIVSGHFEGLMGAHKGIFSLMRDYPIGMQNGTLNGEGVWRPRATEEKKAIAKNAIFPGRRVVSIDDIVFPLLMPRQGSALEIKTAKTSLEQGYGDASVNVPFDIQGRGKIGTVSSTFAPSYIFLGAIPLKHEMMVDILPPSVQSQFQSPVLIEARMQYAGYQENPFVFSSRPYAEEQSSMYGGDLRPLVFSNVPLPLPYLLPLENLLSKGYDYTLSSVSSKSMANMSSMPIATYVTTKEMPKAQETDIAFLSPHEPLMPVSERPIAQHYAPLPFQSQDSLQPIPSEMPLEFMFRPIAPKREPEERREEERQEREPPKEPIPSKPHQKKVFPAGKIGFSRSETMLSEPLASEQKSTALAPMQHSFSRSVPSSNRELDSLERISAPLEERLDLRSKEESSPLNIRRMPSKIVNRTLDYVVNKNPTRVHPITSAKQEVVYGAGFTEERLRSLRITSAYVRGEFGAEVTYSIKDRLSGSFAGEKEKNPVSPGSRIKTALVYAALYLSQRGEFNLNEMVTKEEIESLRSQGKLFTHEKSPTLENMTREKLLSLICDHTSGGSNTASTYLIHKIGRERLNSVLNDLGYKETVFIDGFYREGEYRKNRSSARDTTQVVDDALSGKHLNKYYRDRFMKCHDALGTHGQKSGWHILFEKNHYDALTKEGFVLRNMLLKPGFTEKDMSVIFRIEGTYQGERFDYVGTLNMSDTKERLVDESFTQSTSTGVKMANTFYYGMMRNIGKGIVENVGGKGLASRVYSPR